ncbi:MAG: hypothetical protein IKD04_01785 [Clostridia bacterium]|nr:hypothetical protein [Clostridia bacterium]
MDIASKKQSIDDFSSYTVNFLSVENPFFHSTNRRIAETMPPLRTNCL